MRNVILYVANVFDIITGYGCEGHSYPILRT